MEQGLGKTVQRIDWLVFIIQLLGIIKSYEKGRPLNGVQGQLVLTAAEESFTGLCPGCPAEWKQIEVWY